MKTRFISAVIVILSVFLIQSEGARILGVFVAPSKSHIIIHSAVAETLAQAGHNVTVIATTPNVYKNSTYHHINVGESPFDSSFTNAMVNIPTSPHKSFAKMIFRYIKLSNATLSQPKMIDFLKTHRAGDFDLVILGYAMADFVLGIGAHFQCPIVVSWMVQPIILTNSMIGNFEETSYVPSLIAGIRQPMNFLERVQNFVHNVMEQTMAYIIKLETEKCYRYNFPADRYPPLEEVYKNVSLVLTNHHFSQGPIRPNVPASIEIGGIQIKEKPDALPKDLADIMDSAERVIYFSLGSIVKGYNLPKEKAKMIFNVLSKLPYTILLKWSDSELPGQSDNMIYRSWLPQDDILAHPKVKLFITHGGQGSVAEAQYHGVPMVGIPLFVDQHANVASVIKSGFGRSLDYASLTEEGFRDAVMDVLTDTKYASNIKQFSQLYRDRPMTPRELVRYWVDYVIRHNGAKHMQSPAVYMSWWQLNSVDVIAFLLAIVFSVVGILVALCKFVCCRSAKYSTNQKKKITKSKKQE